MILVEDRGGGVIIKIVNDLLEFILKWKTLRGTAEEEQEGDSNGMRNHLANNPSPNPSLCVFVQEIPKF